VLVFMRVVYTALAVLYYSWLLAPVHPEYALLCSSPDNCHIDERWHTGRVARRTQRLVAWRIFWPLAEVDTDITSPERNKTWVILYLVTVLVFDAPANGFMGELTEGRVQPR